MFSTTWFRRAVCVASTLAGAATLSAQAPPAATLYRVFLRDGSTLVSYGEYTRVADRVVVTLAIGTATSDTTNDAAGKAPDLQLLSIPADTVDWDKTDAYADSARAARYAATSGPNDYAGLTNAVSVALSDIATTQDPRRKVAMATEARQNVMKWTADHYGYRAQDVSHLASLFDDVIAETRRANGEPNYELSLVASVAAPPDVPLLPPPTLQESVDQAMRAVTLAPDAGERLSLLQSIERTLSQAGADAAWAAPFRTRVVAAIATEERTDREYATLTRDTLRRAQHYSTLADVTGVERVVRGLLKEDDRLGQRRPQAMAALLATLDARLDATRRLRLARDNREARAGVLRKYQRDVAGPIAIVARSRTSIDEIRRLAGPSRLRLIQVGKDLKTAMRFIEAVTPPAEASEAHDLLKQAVQLAARAVQERQAAVESNNMERARDASSAAAGALMLFDRAAGDITSLTK
jgi:hypothetical protein